MRILLLRPDSGIYTVLPPLGLMALAAYFRANGNHQVEIYDGRERCAEDRDILHKVESFQPDAIGISVLTMERTEGHHTAKIIKENFPRTTVILGGPYSTSETDEALTNPAVDFAVVGEGEIPGLKLIDALENGGDIGAIRGVAFLKEGRIVNSGSGDAVTDLDTLPQMAWDLIDLERYFYNPKRPTPMNLHTKSTRSAPILTTRGCPYQCTYCHNLFGKKLRSRSADHVLEEIRYLKEVKGVEEIEIVDDCFNLDLNRARTLASQIIKEGLGLFFSLPNGVRADRMPEDLIDLLLEMGTYRIVFAVESGSQEIQRQVRKNLNLKKAMEAINYAASKGISVGGFFILGFLNETEEQAKQTIDFACNSQLSTASFFVLTPFPRTRIYEQAKAAGFQLDDTALTHYYAFGVNISQIPDRRLRWLYKYAYRRFYLHPLRLYRFFKTTPWRKFFFRKLYIALLFFFHNFKAERRVQLDQTSRGRWKRPKYA